MKRICCMVLGIALLVSLAGCSDKDVQSVVCEDRSSQVSLSTSSSSSLPVPVPSSLTAPDVTDLEKLYELYMNPVIFSRATRVTWTDANTLDATSFVRMYGYTQVWNATIPDSEMVMENGTPYYYVDAATLEHYVTTYFDVSTDHLRSSGDYDTEKQAYKFNMDGVGFAYDPQIMRAEYDDTKHTLTLYLDSGREDNRNEVAAIAILLKEDGSFQYIGNDYFGG